VPWGKNILAPTVNKTIEFKMKNKCERSKSRTFTVVISLSFEGNKMQLVQEMNSTNLQ